MYKYKQNISYVALVLILSITALLSACGSEGGTPEGDVTDSDAVTNDMTNLEISFSGTDTLDAVKGDLTLPITGSSGTTISWSSSYTVGGADASTVISTSGVVTRPAGGSGDAYLTLTALIVKGNDSATMEFFLTVLETAGTDTQAVADDKVALDITYGSSDTSDSVTVDLTLPISGASGTTISWSSDTPSIIATDGTVVRSSLGHAAVTLTATITKNAASDFKSFNLIVIKLGRQIFVSSSVYTGNLGGVSGADAKCNVDANNNGNPNSIFKALLVDGINRNASDTSNFGDNQIDWVLKPDADYYLNDGSGIIFTSDSNSLFVFGDFDATFTGGLPGGPYWTGLNSDWTMATGQTCSSWTDGSAVSSGNIGSTSATDGNSISTSSISCDIDPSPAIVCVEQ